MLRRHGNRVRHRNGGCRCRSNRLLLDDLDRPAVFVMEMVFRVIEVPFRAFLIALVTAIAVRLAGMGISRESDGEDQEEGK